VIVKKGAARLGFDVLAFGAHSLRSGLVTSAVKRGVSLLKICDQTRHKSIEMLRIYCRDAELFVGNAAAGLLSEEHLSAFTGRDGPGRIMGEIDELHLPWLPTLLPLAVPTAC
jgi:hypothetical protein